MQGIRGGGIDIIIGENELINCESDSDILPDYVTKKPAGCGYEKISVKHLFGHKNQNGLMDINDHSEYCLKNAILAILKADELKKNRNQSIQ